MTSFADLERRSAQPLGVPHDTSVPTRSGDCGCGGGGGGSDECGCAGTCDLHGSEAGLERTRYYPRQIVTSDDLTQDQLYVRDRLRLHNRFLHGWGIACGLTVQPCADDTGEGLSCRVKVSAGYAIDPYGNEIVVGTGQVLDLCKEDLEGNLSCVPRTDSWCQPVDAVRRPGAYHLAVRWIEEAIKPVHAATGCSCRESSCENSRIRDGHEFRLLAELPSHYKRTCASSRPCLGIDSCPPCPESGWILLATVTVDGATVLDLDRRGRQYLASHARQCFTCDDQPDEVVGGHAWAEGRYVAAASDHSDAMVVVNAVIDDRPAQVAVAVKRDQIAGSTAIEVKELLDQVMVFNVADPTATPFRAGVLLAHSNLNGSSVLDGPEDLSARVGVPVVELAAYDKLVADVEGLFDESGRREFREAKLGNISRLGELAVEVLAQVADVNATRLRSAGIVTLADLAAAGTVPKLSTTAADKRVEAVREILRTDRPDGSSTGGLPPLASSSRTWSDG
jgi:hypothetical protein